MNDSEIVELYLQRNEQAIEETSAKYGAYCMKISLNILGSELESEECVNDTYMQAWKAIPPQHPTSLSAFLAKITRNLAINRYKACHADKRAAAEFALSLDELDGCVSGSFTVESQTDNAMIGRSISDFLRTQPEQARRIFVCRYFYCDSISQIADLFKVSESKVKSVLFRTRNKLKQYLEEVGITV